VTPLAWCADCEGLCRTGSEYEALGQTKIGDTAWVNYVIYLMFDECSTWQHFSRHRSTIGAATWIVLRGLYLQVAVPVHISTFPRMILASNDGVRDAGSPTAFIPLPFPRLFRSHFPRSRPCVYGYDASAETAS
jgi:hypothetical protein